MKKTKTPPRKKPSRPRADGDDQSTVRDEIKGLQKWSVNLVERASLERYLHENLGLLQILPRVCEKVRNEFPAAELSFAVYQDPEIEDEFLVLYVRFSQYRAGILDRIDIATAEFAPQIEAVTGHLLVTTDFRSPRGSNGL